MFHHKTYILDNYTKDGMKKLSMTHTGFKKKTNAYKDIKFYEGEEILGMGVRGKIDTNFTLTRLIINIDFALIRGDFVTARRAIDVALSSLDYYVKRMQKEGRKSNVHNRVNKLNSEILLEHNKITNSNQSINEINSQLRFLEFKYLKEKNTILHDLMAELGMKPECLF